MVMLLWLILVTGVTIGPYVVSDCPSWARDINAQRLAPAGIFREAHGVDSWRAYCTVTR